VLYTGATSDKVRDAAVVAFTTPRTDEDPGPSVVTATDAGSEALNLGKCCSTIINLDVPWKATSLEQRGNRVHRIDGTAEKNEVINLVLTGTLEHGLLAMFEPKAELPDAILGESGGRTRTTGGKGRNFFDQALESWSENPE
jgi:SNF2 family DNA or RNA helicase